MLFLNMVKTMLYLQVYVRTQAVNVSNSCFRSQESADEYYLKVK